MSWGLNPGLADPIYLANEWVSEGMGPFQHKTNGVTGMMSVEEYRGDRKRSGLKQDFRGGERSELCLKDL